MINQNEKQGNGLTVRENGRRVLTVLYSLSDGRPGVSVQKDDLLRECNRVGVYSMTEEEFEAYRASVVASAHVLDADEIG